MVTKTLLNVDRELLKEAQEILHAPNMSATVNQSLRETVARAALHDLAGIAADMSEDERDLAYRVRDVAW